MILRNANVVLRAVLCLGFLSTMAACASDKVRDATTWLASAANEVKDKAVVFKDQRDALASARQMGINSLERSAAFLDAQTAETVQLWAIADVPGGKSLLDTINAQMLEAEKRQKAWDDLIAQEQKKLAQAKSTIVPATDKLAQTINLLGQLGEEKGFGEQVQFYTGFFSQLRSSLKKLEEDAAKAKEAGMAAIEAKNAAGKVDPTGDDEK